MSRRGEAGRGTERPNANNQHGNIVKYMNSIECVTCGFFLRQGDRPKRARSYRCHDCGQACWTIEHPTLGYVRGAVPCDA